MSNKKKRKKSTKKSLASQYREIKSNSTRENRDTNRTLRSSRIVKYLENPYSPMPIFQKNEVQDIGINSTQEYNKVFTPSKEKKTPIISYLIKNEEEKAEFRTVFFEKLCLTPLHEDFVINSVESVCEKSSKEKAQLLYYSEGSETRLRECIDIQGDYTFPKIEEFFNEIFPQKIVNLVSKKKLPFGTKENALIKFFYNPEGCFEWIYPLSKLNQQERRREEEEILKRNPNILRDLTHLRLCDVDVPVDVILLILEYIAYNRKLFRGLACVNENFLLLVLSTWRKLIVVTSKVFSISLIVLKSLREVIFKGKFSYKEIFHLFSNLSPDKLNIIDFQVGDICDIDSIIVKEVKLVFPNVHTFKLNLKGNYLFRNSKFSCFSKKNSNPESVILKNETFPNILNLYNVKMSELNQFNVSHLKDISIKVDVKGNDFISDFRCKTLEFLKKFSIIKLFHCGRDNTVLNLFFVRFLVNIRKISLELDNSKGNSSIIDFSLMKNLTELNLISYEIDCCCFGNNIKDVFWKKTQTPDNNEDDERLFLSFSEFKSIKCENLVIEYRKPVVLRYWIYNNNDLPYHSLFFNHLLLEKMMCKRWKIMYDVEVWKYSYNPLLRRYVPTKPVYSPYLLFEYNTSELRIFVDFYYINEKDCWYQDKCLRLTLNALFKIMVKSRIYRYIRINSIVDEYENLVTSVGKNAIVERVEPTVDNYKFEYVIKRNF